MEKSNGSEVIWTQKYFLERLNEKLRESGLPEAKLAEPPSEENVFHVISIKNRNINIKE